MATLTNVAVRYITVYKNAVSERSSWYTSSATGYLGYRDANTKSTIQLRAYLSEPCTSITLKVTPTSTVSSSAVYYFKASPNETDATLDIASNNVTTTTYDVKNSNTKYAWSPVEVTINGNFKAGYIYVYVWANATNQLQFGNDTYPTKITSATSATAYTLTLTQGSNSTISVNRSSSNFTSTGALSNGAKLYSGDKLTITFSAASGYNVGTHTVNGSTFTSGGSHTVSGNVTVVSSATKKTYTVTFNANGGTGAPSAQTKTHGTTLALSTTKPTKTKTTATGYKVTFNANGGSCSTTDLTSTLTTTYAFKNWNTAANGSGTSYASGASYTANAAVTLYAQWTPSTSNGSVSLPTPTRTGFTFKGWATSSSATSGSTGDYTPTAAVTLYATWSANSITFDYYSNNGTQTKFATWTASASGTWPNNHWNYRNGTYKQTYTGYTATGYYGTTTTGGTLVGEDEQMASYAAMCEKYGVSTSVASTTIKIYAQWVPNTYIVRFNGNGGQGTMTDFMVTYDNEVSLPLNTFLKSGYAFLGWDTASSGTAIAYTDGQNILNLTTENGEVINLYAIWKSNGVVYIFDGEKYSPYSIYIGNGTEWELYIPYVGNGTDWDIYG